MSVISLEKIGATQALISPYLKSEEVKKELNRFPSMTVIGLGQGGGRIAAELSRFGLPTYIVNSSKSDMEEHSKLIPAERRILTTSVNYAEMEGTSKNAALGLEIAKENQQAYKEIAISTEVQNSDFVWVSVSLGGGTGNGALKVALTFLSKIRSNRQLPNGKIPLGVICSIPSKDERGSTFRKNALAGIALLQSMVQAGTIGSVIVIDNEKMQNYYAETPLKTYGGTEIDAKSYSNMVVASLIIETATLPLLQGRSVYDKAEYLDTISTPGWLSIAKLERDVEAVDQNIEGLISDLFTKNEVLAETRTDHATFGAVGVIYPANQNVSPKLADDVYRFSSSLLDTTINLAISSNSALKELTLYGLSVTSVPPNRISELKVELEEWEKREKELEEQKKQAAAALDLSGFEQFLSTDSLVKRNKVATLDDLGDFGDDDKQVAKTATLADLDDLDF